MEVLGGEVEVLLEESGPAIGLGTSDDGLDGEGALDLRVRLSLLHALLEQRVERALLDEGGA